MEVLKKLKFFKKKGKNSANKSNNKNNWLYLQALFSNVKEILKIKENFSNIPLKKIEEIYKTINNSSKPKPRINMTTRRSFRYQVIIPIETDNISKFMSLSGDHISNINSTLKNIKLEILADFVHNNHCGLIITTNKIFSQYNPTTIKNYIKNVNAIESNLLLTLVMLNQTFKHLINAYLQWCVFSIKTVYYQDIAQIWYGSYLDQYLWHTK